MLRKLRSIYALLLLLFLASCQQPTSQENNEIAELNISWRENENRFIDWEKWATYNQRCILNLPRIELATVETQCLIAIRMNNDTLYQVTFFGNLGAFQLMRGNLQDGLNHLGEARTLLGDKDSEAAMFLDSHIGKAFVRMGNIDAALYYIQKALDKSIEVGNVGVQAINLAHIGVIFFHIGDYSQAEAYYRKSIPLFEQIENNAGLAAIYSNLAGMMLMQNRMEDALFYAQKSDKIAQSIGIPAVAMRVIYTFMGTQYFRENNYRNSLEMFYRALDLAIQIRDLQIIANSYSQVGRAYGRLRNFDRSEYFINKALEIAQRNENHRLKISALRGLVPLYASRGDIAQLEKIVDTKWALRDSLLTQQRIEAVQELQIRFETEQREQYIAQQREIIRYERAQRVLISIISIIFILLSVLFFVYQQRKMRRIKLMVQQYETILKLKKETQHQAVDFEKSATISDMSKKLLPGIERLFKEEKIYTQPGLSVDDVAKALNTNRNYLSTAINECYQKRFPEFVNTFRIDDAIEMLKEQGEGGNYAHYTIQAIGEEVGFIGKNSFNSAFKQMVGVAPSEYQKTLKDR